MQEKHNRYRNQRISKHVTHENFFVRDTFGVRRRHVFLVHHVQTGAALVIEYLLAIPLGLLAAVRKNKITDKALTITTVVLWSMLPDEYADLKCRISYRL